MKYTTTQTLLLIFSSVILLQCTKQPLPINENELITRVQLTFTDTLGETSSFLYCINDGMFGNRKDTIVLMKNKAYGLEISFYNVQSASVVDSINNEILEEAEEHQIFIQSTTIDNFRYNDEDYNTYPIGLKTLIKTNNILSLEYFRIILIHQPNKKGFAVAQNQVKNAGGATDVDISFLIKLQ